MTDHLTTFNPTDLILDRLTDREFAREWLKAHDEEVERVTGEFADMVRAVHRTLAPHAKRTVMDEWERLQQERRKSTNT